MSHTIPLFDIFTVFYAACGIEQYNFIFCMAFLCNASRQFLVMLTKIVREYNLCYQVLDYRE